MFQLSHVRRCSFCSFAFKRTKSATLSHFVYLLGIGWRIFRPFFMSWLSHVLLCTLLSPRIQKNEICNPFPLCFFSKDWSGASFAFFSCFNLVMYVGSSCRFAFKRTKSITFFLFLRIGRAHLPPVKNHFVQSTKVILVNSELVNG
jgi:hypothetical protein